MIAEKNAGRKCFFSTWQKTRQKKCLLFSPRSASIDMLFNRQHPIVRAFEHLGEVPKLAEGTPLERVQVVNSGARVQIPPSPFPKMAGNA